MQRIGFILLVLVFITSCKSTKVPTHINSKTYFTNYNAVVLTGFVLPPQLKHRADVKDHIKQKVTELFTTNGVKVIDESHYFSEFENQKKMAGGYIDEYTGKVNEDKRDAVRLAALNALKQTHGIDSVLFYDIRSRSAYFGDYRASWDGQSEPYEKNNSDVANFLSSIIFETSGKIPAISLMVFLEDVTGNELYKGAGGLQLIAKLNDDEEFESVPVKELLQDKALLNFSVEQAFKKFFKDENNN